MSNDLTIKVSTQVLLGKLHENREAHAAAYVLAHEGYVQDLREELTDLLAKLEAGEPVGQHLKNKIPENHTDDYDLAIDMFSMALGGEVELDSSQFREYVKDDWGWKRMWSALNSAYITKASVSRGREW